MSDADTDEPDSAAPPPHLPTRLRRWGGTLIAIAFITIFIRESGNQAPSASRIPLYIIIAASAGGTLLVLVSYLLPWLKTLRFSLGSMMLFVFGIGLGFSLVVGPFEAEVKTLGIMGSLIIMAVGVSRIVRAAKRPEITDDDSE